MIRSRFCPVSGTICQAQCWQDSRGAKNVELYGAEALMQPGNPWDVDLDNFLQASFERWQKSRYAPGTMMPSLDELRDGEVTSTSGSFIPVCYDPLIKPGNFDIKKESKVMPCACGSIYGNETKAFFREAGFGNYIEADRALGDRCFRDLQGVGAPPLEMYMTLCELGYHWPLLGKTGEMVVGYITLGEDPHCGQVRQWVTDRKTESQGRMTKEELNCKLCFLSDVGKAIKEEQLHAVYKSLFHSWKDSLKDKCRRYNDHHQCPGVKSQQK